MTLLTSTVILNCRKKGFNFFFINKLFLLRVTDLNKAKTLLSNTLDNAENTVLRIDEEIEAIKPRLILLWK